MNISTAVKLGRTYSKATHIYVLLQCVTEKIHNEKRQSF